MQNLLHGFDDFFQIMSADTPKLIEDAQHLRYEIFCGEKGYFDASNVEHIEKDNYDSRSTHSLMLHRLSGEYAATVRLVLPDKINQHFKFPLEERISANNIDATVVLNSVPRINIAEISRFSVSKAFRRRFGEQQFIHGINNRFGLQINFKGRRLDSFITLGLFKAIVKMSAQHNIHYWCAFMEPSLLRLLSRIGIEFKPLGESINYFGERFACFEKAHSVLEGIRNASPEIWSFITEEGKITLDSSRSMPPIIA